MIKIRELYRKPRDLLFLYLYFYFIIWHFTILFFGSGFTPAKIAKELQAVFFIYTVLNVLLSGFIISFSYGTSRRIVRRLFMVIMMILFSLSVIIRIIDWGAVYYGGVHVDEDFWYHAFYVDSTVFMRMKLSYILYGISAVLIYCFTRIIRPVVMGQAGTKEANLGSEPGRPAFKSIIAPSLVAAALPGIIVMALLIPFRTSKGLSREISSLYTGIPEKEFLVSFYRSVIAGSGNEKELPSLDEKIVSKMKKAGVVLNSISTEYPLLKKSIYLDPSNRNRDMPKIPPGTNIIIIFAESFSRFFLREDVHGMKGIVENVKDLESRSLRIENMFNADFPTINGVIASLSSSMYHVTKIGGDQGVRPPIIGKYLFITDILKKLDYTTVHIQGGSEFFVGMKDFFIKKQGYDNFIGYETLLKMNLSNLNASFGKSDHDIFTYVKKWLEEYNTQHPFFMSISTINLHSPYLSTHKYPMSDGNPMLDSLYSFDKAFGIFWEYFKKSRFRNNTVLILTADHAIGTNSYISKFRSKFSDQFRSHFDYIPFLMLIPGDKKWQDRTINITCTNLDIVPTLMDMMNMDLVNPFIGLSIFSDRRKYPFPISSNPILDKLNAEERAYVKDLDWTSDDQRKVIDFLLSCVTRRRIIPENFSVEINKIRK